MTEEKPRRSLLKHPLTGVVGSAVILALLLTALPFGDIREAFGRVSLATWIAAIAVYLAMHLLGIIKWRSVVNAANADLPFRAAAQAYYMGLFGNTFLPSLVGGDIVRAGVAMRAVRSKSGLILGSVVDRLQDVVGLAVVAGLGALSSPRALDEESRRVFLALGVAVVIAGAVGVAALVLTPVRRFPWKVRRRLVQVRTAIRATAAQPGTLVSALVLGMLLQGLLATLNWWLGLKIGIDVPFYVWMFVWPLAKIAAMLPLTQNGIGVREAAFVALCAPFGIGASQAVAASLVFQVVVALGGLTGGLIGWLLARRPMRPMGVVTS